MKGLSKKKSISRPEQRRRHQQGRAGGARPRPDTDKMDKGESLGYANTALTYRSIGTRTLYEHSNT